MSIVTKTGDLGTTALMFNRRVPKHDDRVEAYGAIDELNAALGLARATAVDKNIGRRLEEIQKDLVSVMGEVATAAEDLERYAKLGYPRVTATLTQKLEEAVKELEAKNIVFAGWATPGANLHAAALDMARTVCRRAERRVCHLQEKEKQGNPEIIVFLNRLSDLLWLLARAGEQINPG